MRKVLLYHLYVNDIISDNKNYTIHKECLTYYRHIFDEMIFYIVLDDISNDIIINDTVKWIGNICKDKIFDIKIRKNTKLCEVSTFKNELIDNRDFYKDDLVFIAHTKNVSRLYKDLTLNAKPGYDGSDVIPDSIIKWCISSYFYNLNFIDEVEERLYGCPFPAELFYGSFLTEFKESCGNPMLKINKANCFYVGSFYWINMAKFNNYIDKKIIELSNIDDRYWFENLPGVICDIKND